MPARALRKSGRSMRVRNITSMHRLNIPALVLGLVVIIAYESLTEAGLLARQLPSVANLWTAGVTAVGGSIFWAAVIHTVVAWIIGIAIASGVGIPVGLLLGSSRFAFKSSRVLVEFLRPIPPVAILPLAIITLGIGMKMELWLVAFAAIWPIVLQAMYGVHDVDRIANDTMRVYGVDGRKRYRYLVLPSALPYIATGIRVASALGLVVAISTELIAGGGGMGFLIDRAEYAGHYALMYVIIGTAGVIGIVSTMTLKSIERRLLRWHQSYR